MPNFKVRIVGGKSTHSINLSGFSQSKFMGMGESTIITAENRADAYIKVARHLSEQGAEVTVLGPVAGQTMALGFTAEEWEIIQQSGVPMTQGYPDDGYQIEQIVQVEEENIDL